MSKQKLLDIVRFIRDDSYPHPSSYNVPKVKFESQCYDRWAIDHLIRWLEEFSFVDAEMALDRYYSQMNSFVCDAVSDEQRNIFISALEVANVIIDAVIDEEILLEKEGDL